MDNSIKEKLALTKWVVRTLAISASTLAVVAFIKGEFQSGATLAVAWLAIVTAEKRMSNNSSSTHNESTQEEK